MRPAGAGLIDIASPAGAGLMGHQAATHGPPDVAVTDPSADTL